MFSKDITENDAFLDMPLSTQALYFHLGMQADDDGFVSPVRIVRMLGAQTDDLKLLISKKFLLPFEDGVVVIKHWKINNYLRSDRYKETPHREKIALLSVKNNNAYTWYTNGIPLVDAGKDSIGKDTIAEQSSDGELKDKKEKEMFNKYSEEYLEDDVQVDPDFKPKGKKKAKKVSDDVQAVFDLFDNPASALWRLREIERVAAQTLFDTYGLETLERRIKRIKQEKENGDQYFPHVVTPSQLLDKMEAVERYLNV